MKMATGYIDGHQRNPFNCHDNCMKPTSFSFFITATKHDNGPSKNYKCAINNFASPIKTG